MDPANSRSMDRQDCRSSLSSASRLPICGNAAGGINAQREQSSHLIHDQSGRTRRRGNPREREVAGGSSSSASFGMARNRAVPEPYPTSGGPGDKPDSRRTHAICPTGVITILHYTGDVSALPATGTVLRVADIQPRTASATTSCIAPATQTPAHPRFDQPYAPRAEPTAPPRK